MADTVHHCYSWLGCTRRTAGWLVDDAGIHPISFDVHRPATSGFPRPPYGSRFALLSPVNSLPARPL